MITCMSDILCVTNRKLCKESFLTRIEKIAQAKPAGIILREKDLCESDYMTLAADVLAVCRQYNVPCILHSFVRAAAALEAESIHLPLPLLLRLSGEDKARFSTIGASCHSVEEAAAAEEKGCTYITAGHVFETDCKAGLPGRGLAFLKTVCERVSIPVYAIGGIRVENIDGVRRCGAKGACVMSGAMTCADVRKYLGEFI